MVTIQHDIKAFTRRILNNHKASILREYRAAKHRRHYILIPTKDVATGMVASIRSEDTVDFVLRQGGKAIAEVSVYSYPFYPYVEIQLVFI